MPDHERGQAASSCGFPGAALEGRGSYGVQNVGAEARIGHGHLTQRAAQFTGHRRVYCQCTLTVDVQLDHTAWCPESDVD